MTWQLPILKIAMYFLTLNWMTKILAFWTIQVRYIQIKGRSNNRQLALYFYIGQVERLQKKSNDPVAMLISLCGSRTKFAEKYKEAMAKSLLLSQDYDTDQEVMQKRNGWCGKVLGFLHSHTLFAQGDSFGTSQAALYRKHYGWKRCHD